MIPNNLKNPPTLSINSKEMDVLDNLINNALSVTGNNNAYNVSLSRRQLEVLQASIVLISGWEKFYNIKGLVSELFARF